MQTKNSFPYIVLGLLAGIFGTLFFQHILQFTPDRINARMAAHDKVENLEAKAKAIQDKYDSKLDTLQQTNTALSKKVSNTQSELVKAKQDKQVLLGLVDGLIARADSAGLHSYADTVQRLADCDTLQTTVKELVAASRQTDSIYDDLTYTLGRQIANRDSVITTQQLEYAGLQVTFDESLLQQQLLSGQIGTYQKQAGQFKTKNRLLSAGVLVLTGIATYGLLKH